MDHSWRPRPPIQGNICPTCSISHFPFCPPPHHSFNENRRFQSHNEYFFQRPPFDPFLDHRGPTVNPTRPFVGNPSDGFGDPRPWHRNPSLDRDTYSQFQGQSQIGDSDIVNRDYCRDGFGPPNYDHSSVGGYKRMRVDGMGENHASSSRILSEDDRRLKLIREHGIVPSGPAQGGVNLVSDFDCETMGYMREHSVLNKSFGKMDGEEYGMYNELRGGRNDMTLKPISNVGMNDFQSPGIGSFDRKGSSFDMELGFYMNKYRDEHGLALGQQYMRSNRNEELEQSHYGKVENSLTYSLHDNGRRSYLDHFPVVEQTQLSLDEVAPYRGGNPYNSNTRDGYISVSPKDDLKQTTFMSQSVHYPIPEVPYENYQNHTFRRIHSSDPVSTKEPHYSHPTDWQEMLGSNTLYHEQRSIATMDDRNLNNQLPRLYTKQNHMQLNHDFHSASQLSDMRRSVGVNTPSDDGLQGPVGHRNFRVLSPRARQYLEEEAGYPPMATGSDVGPTHASRVFNLQPPLPASPPPPLPLDPPGHPYSEPLASSSPPKAPSSLFPIAVSSSANVPSLYPSAPEAHLLAQTYYTNKPQLHASTGFSNEEFQARQGLAEKYLGEGQTFPLRHFSSDEPKIVDAFHIFKQPHRATRPDHMVIILRGLPGSGKSYLAKMLRDLEVENGGNAPRIHSMDDYFMTEVEKVEESEVSKSSGSVRGKKPATKKVMEYCYEPEMEEAYRSSMLKAFKKTIDEGVFSFIIVDDRNLRVADFAQFWATAKRSGYEVYLLEATYKDPAGCAARNVHGFSQDDIEKMAGQWEEAPSLYLKLDVKSLLHGDGFEESGIQEVDMDTEDGDPAGSLSGSEERNPENVIVPSVEDFKSNGPSKDYKRWDAEGGHPVEEVKELRRSKWSDDLDEDDAERTEGIKGNSSALSGLIQAYSKEGKSVSWGDQVGNTGFSIGASKKAKVLSLVIGPGFGYNLKSNPLPEENLISAPNTGESKKRNIFQEQLRAERESFKAVFDKRRQRISGLDVDED